MIKENYMCYFNIHNFICSVNFLTLKMMILLNICCLINLHSQIYSVTRKSIQQIQ